MISVHGLCVCVWLSVHYVHAFDVCALGEGMGR